MKKPKVPETITDEEMADLSKRARGRGEPMFSRKAVAQRKASEIQRSKAGLS
jgi:hypothetical protein